MSDPGDESVMDFQHREIDEAETDLAGMQRRLEKLLDLRHNRMPADVEDYLRGLYDGLYYGEERIKRVTRYDDHGRLYDARTVSDGRLADALQVVVTEARCENWGNVRVNLENALERAQEFDAEGTIEEMEADGDE